VSATAAAARTRAPYTVHLALAVVSLLFGGNYFAAKIAMREVAPPALVVLRAWGTTAILFAWMSAVRPSVPRSPLSRKDLVQLFVLSVLGASINQYCFLEGLSRSTATNAGIIFMINPVLTMAFAVLLKRETASPRAMLGVALGVVGATLMIVPRGGFDMSARAAGGNALLVLGSVTYALYLVLARPILARLDPIRVMSWVFLFAGLTILPIGLRDLSTLFGTGLSPAGLGAVLYAVVGATVIPYVLNTWALARVQSSIVSVYILIQPVVAAFLGYTFLGETLAPNAALAAALVLAGVALTAWRPAPAEAPAPPASR